MSQLPNNFHYIYIVRFNIDQIDIAMVRRRWTGKYWLNSETYRPHFVSKSQIPFRLLNENRSSLRPYIGHQFRSALNVLIARVAKVRAPGPLANINWLWLTTIFLPTLAWQMFGHRYMHVQYLLTHKHSLSSTHTIFYGVQKLEIYLKSVQNSICNKLWFDKQSCALTFKRDTIQWMFLNQFLMCKQHNLLIAIALLYAQRESCVDYLRMCVNHFWSHL